MTRIFSRFITVCIAGVLLTFGFLSGLGHAAAEEVQSAVEWSRDYGSNSTGKGVISTSDGGYLALGSIYEKEKVGPEDWQWSLFQKSYILKLDAEGQVEWEQKLKNNSDNSTAYLAIEPKDGGYLVVGSARGDGEPIHQLFIVRLDSSGNVLWEKALVNDGFSNTPEAIVETDDGSFLIAGTGISRGVAYETPNITKIDKNGETLWYKRYRFSGTADSIYDLIPATDGGYIAVGFGGNVEYESKELDALLMVKIDDQGQQVWLKQFADPGSRWTGQSIIASEDGGYVILSSKYMDRKRVTVLTKTDSNGQVQWEKTYHDGANSESFNRLLQTQEGYVMLGGHTTKGALDWRQQYNVVNVDAYGGFISRELFKGAPIYNIGTTAATPDGGFIFSGTVLRGDDNKFQLMKVSPSEARPPAERTLTGISFTDKEKKLKAGASVTTVLQAVYSDGVKDDLSSAAVYIAGDSAIADVDALGRITGHMPGQTYVEATYEGFTARINVTVFPEDTDEFDPVFGSIKLDSGEYSVMEGSSLDLKVTFYDYNTNTETDITKQTTFISDNPDIAEVDEEGNLIGHKPGETIIYAKYKGSLTYASVMVVHAPVSE